MRTHLSSVAEENKLSDGSANVGVCETPQAGAGVGAVAGAGKKPVCMKTAAAASGAATEGAMFQNTVYFLSISNANALYFT